MGLNLFARKDLRAMLSESEGEKGGLKRSLGALNLVTLGIGAIIGTGIFVLTGTVAATYAGPAVVISFIIAGIVSAFAGLCYAEFSALIPIAGSAYSYAYTTLGEIVAWMIGWALILEYAFGAATVAVGWSGYVSSLLANFGMYIPAQWTGAPGTDMVMLGGHWQKAAGLTAEQLTGLTHMAAVFNLPAFIGILAVTAILVIGIQESATVNNAIVAVKISVLLIFVGLGINFIFLTGHMSVATANWHPFIPPNTGHFGEFGWSGILRGAGVIFFAYIGFDAVSTAAQEAKNPKKDMPIGILGSLIICTILYIIVALLTTGLKNYTQLNVAEPIALAVDVTGVTWGSILVKVGAIGGLSSTMLVMLLGQSRIFFTMSSDGLLWKWAGKIHPKFRTPYISTMLVGLCVATLAASLPVSTLAELTSVGTLFAFTIVCVGVWILRVREPDLPRPFKTPWVPFVPIVGALASLALMLTLHWLTWEVFLIWLALGLVVYFTYSQYHSRVQLAEGKGRGA
jgi:APA family basic amino acid/polyamine antiporter